MTGNFFSDLAREPLLQAAVAAGGLSSVACGAVGTFVVVRRISYVAAGISHSILGGMGAAIYLSSVCGLKWATPLTGAVVAALLSAAIIGIASLRFKQREDTVISALWAIGMAAGVIFIAKSPGYQQNLMSYLFGDILLVPRGELWLIAALDAVVLILTGLFYKQLLAVCFDEEFARSRGVNVQAYYLLLLGLTALTVVLLVTVVGTVLTIALLTLPVAVAAVLARRLWHVMAAAIVLSLLLTTSGLALSYAPELPSGAVIIILAGAVYLVVLAGQSLLGRARIKGIGVDGISGGQPPA
jgi:zinc transport system permease protein